MDIGNLATSKRADKYRFRLINLIRERVDFVALGMAPPTALNLTSDDTGRERGFEPFRRLKYHTVVSDEVHSLARSHFIVPSTGLAHWREYPAHFERDKHDNNA